MQRAGDLTHHDPRVLDVTGSDVQSFDFERADLESRKVGGPFTGSGGISFVTLAGTRGRIENDDGPQQMDAVGIKASAQGRRGQIDLDAFSAEERLPGGRAVGDDHILQRHR